MPKLRSPIYAFNGGEISRRMEGRSDLDGIWDRAFETMVNYVATVEGPATKRPGFRYIKEAALSSTWISSFVFNTTQSYVLEWLEGKIRFFTNGGRIENAGVPYEVVTPYTAAEAPAISSIQSYDRLYLAHPNHPPAMLTRTGAETFTYAPIPLKNGPFKDYNTDLTKTISWAGNGTVGGVATISCDFDLFLPGHVGASFIFQVESFSTIDAWEPNVVCPAVGSLVKSDGKVYKLVSTGGHKYTGTIEPTHNNGSEWDGSGQQSATTTDATATAGCLWEYQFNRFGIATITSIQTTSSAKVTVTQAFPTISPSTHFWAHAAFSNVEGWPQLVGTWGSRLCFVKDIQLCASVVGDYWNMNPIDDDGVVSPDMAFRLPLNISDPPTWMHSDTSGIMLLGSHKEETMVSQINRAAGISADNIDADWQSSYGSAAVFPVKIGLSILFIQRGARKIREAQFDYYRGRFVAQHINVYARQITRSGVNWISFQQEPENILWGGRNDGTMFAHPHDPEQEVKGFSRVALAQGSILSGVALPNQDGSGDDLWVLAELNGSKGVLQLGTFWDEDAGLEQSDAFFVDWGVSYNGTGAGVGGVDVPKQNFTQGLSHLEGMNVRVLFDGAETNDLTVHGGAIMLPAPAVKVHIGLGFQATLKLLRTEARGTPTAQGLRKRVARLFARMVDSASLIIFNRLGEQTEMFERESATAMGSPSPLFNGDTDNKSVGGGGSDFADQPVIVNDDALPSIITLLVPTYQIEDAPGD